jgi:phospholipase C
VNGSDAWLSPVTPPADINRRRFLSGVAGSAALASLPAGMAEAAAEPRKQGSLDDVEHVVVLMQENRSFDHYYGTLRGVRGFSDPAALDGVFRQPDPKRTDGGYLLPFHVDTWKVDGQQLADLDHSWDGTHSAWANGDYNGWIAAKTELTMSYFTESDIRFHHALADAFTICDSYFSSIQGPTTPNRLFLFTGTIDPAGAHGGPAIDNPADYNPVYNWTTYPERLQAAGVSWKVYANKEVGDGGGEDGWVGDYGDNPLWLFQAYHDALASTDPAKRELADRASVHDGWLPNSGQGHDANHVLAEFVNDCRAGTLPRVSFVVAPYAYCEHPQARPVDGARYVDTMLRALFENQKLWNSTAVFLNYDENDGFFDHVLPPVPAPGTPLEFVGGRPIGFGPRVPMTVISPWSRGGWVSSEVTDHTSVIRFLERWTGVREPNISPWRRAIAGDLTAAFDFREHNTTIPMLPDTAAMQADVDKVEPSLPTPTPPATGAQQMPAQNPGTRPARALPYQLLANASGSRGKLTVRMSNQGTAAVQLSVYAKGSAPGTYFVDATGQAQATVQADDVAVHGPNGFLRRFAGVADVEAAVTLNGSVPRLTISNTGRAAAQVTLSDGTTRKITVPAGGTHTETVGTAHGWYDLTCTLDSAPAFTRRFAGHVETGAPSQSSPAL